MDTIQKPRVVKSRRGQEDTKLCRRMTALAEQEEGEEVTISSRWTWVGEGLTNSCRCS